MGFLPSVFILRAHVPCAKDGFGSDTDKIKSGCHLLLYFNPNTDANTDLIRYEYKTDSSNLDSNSDT